MLFSTAVMVILQLTASKKRYSYQLLLFRYSGKFKYSGLTTAYICWTYKRLNILELQPHLYIFWAYDSLIFVDFQITTVFYSGIPRALPYFRLRKPLNTLLFINLIIIHYTFFLSNGRYS